MTVRLSSRRRSGSRQSSQQCQVHVDRFFFDIQGIVHKKFVPPGQTVNGKFYCEVLKRLTGGIRCKPPDNGRTTIGFSTMTMRPPTNHSLFDNFWLPKTLQWFPTPPPLFAWPRSCDFFLFPNMKLRLKGRRFDTTGEIHAESQEVINTLILENFQGCMKSWGTTLGSLYTCPRGLLRRRRWELGATVRNFFMVPEILDSASYILDSVNLLHHIFLQLNALFIIEI
jgi:hypothetical protein